ncbi:AraC family transcriptional regulator [Gordonia sp. L191]|uniref:GlxA family transcriptional regulator n=1 Tax=Gordonia sp. L191 TaxID=2982699 RepID=UPI0024BF76D6|nr:AraC family transcriptional regulator [Gordonia sp. L191]WHU45718.1 AraC family transcriptional regulator [Gordonia sp. L191]
MGDELRSADTRTVVLVGFDDVLLLDLSGPAEVFVAANRQVTGAYELKVVSAVGAVTTSIGASLTTSPIMESRILDTLIIPGSAVSPDRFVVPELVDTVSELASRARRVASVCTGAFVLAAAGLLDGRRATTHWKYTAELARRYPSITVAQDAIFVCDGSTYSSAGATAGIDLALSFVADDLGSEIADRIARDLLVYTQRRGHQSQISPVCAGPVSGLDLIRQVIDRVRADPASPHTVRTMAAAANLSERQLTRIFRQELQTTPASYVADLRFEIACDRLRGGYDLAAAASGAGYSSAEIMRRAFVARIGISPSAFARQVQTGSSTPQALPARHVANRGISVPSGVGGRASTG